MSLLKLIKQYMKTGNIKENYTATIPIKGNLNENKNDYILSAILPSKYNYNEIVISKHN